MEAKKRQIKERILKWQNMSKKKGWGGEVNFFWTESKSEFLWFFFFFFFWGGGGGRGGEGAVLGVSERT